MCFRSVDEISLVKHIGMWLINLHVRLMIRGWAKCDQFDRAFDMLEHSKTYRNIGYLEPIRFKDIWGMFLKADAMSQDGDLSVAKRMVEVCPKPERSDLEMVSRMSGDKHLTRGWWGWDALGVGMSKRSEMIQGHKRFRKGVSREGSLPGFNPKVDVYGGGGGKRDGGRRPMVGRKEWKK